MEAGVEDRGRDWGLLARAAAVGGVAAAALFYALVLVGWTPRDASEVAFPLAALPFAVGLLGWSGVVFSGEALADASRTLGLSRGWTPEGGRRAMAVLVAVGVGGMVGAALAGAPYGV